MLFGVGLGFLFCFSGLVGLFGGCFVCVCVVFLSKFLLTAFPTLGTEFSTNC